MLAVLENLLVLQDRDRKIVQLRSEIAAIAPQRQSLQARSNQAQSQHETIRLRVRQLESDRKRLELEVDARKQQIDKYSLQQFQTKKNDEYRALAHEIELARQDIRKLEDQQLELMEQAEAAHHEAADAQRAAEETRASTEKQLTDLASRERNLTAELETLQSNREELAQAVNPDVRSRYERQRRTKGEKVIVGIHHGVCGGCHMRLSAQTLVSCRAQQEIVECLNCGRILYYTRDMDLVAAD